MLTCVLISSSGVNFMHEKQVVHRDISLENILMDELGV
jgi:serine/threonine protein kinase